MSLESLFGDAMPWVVRLVPDIIRLFNAKSDEDKAIALVKLGLSAERHRIDLALAEKEYPEGRL